MKWRLFRFIFMTTCIAGFSCNREVKKQIKILIFTKTLGYRHTSIENGIAMFKKLGKENGFQIDTSENAEAFTDSNLKKYNAIVFLSTTGEVLDYAQQTSLKRYIEAGGGFMGIHGASGAEYNWPWYGKLVGAWFESHPPKLQSGTINLKDTNNVIVQGLPSSWNTIEEWYNFKSISPDINVLATVDENTYRGGKHGNNHPIFWYHDFDGGRSFYTALGHRPESYEDPIFVKHILGGLKYVMGKIAPLDYSKSHTIPVPKENQFYRDILAGSEAVQEPMELSISNDSLIFFVERRGNVRVYDAKTKKARIIGTIPVYSEHEDGLLGMALDPNFDTNHWLYVFYSAPSKEFNYHLSRFTYDAEKQHLDAESEKVMLKIHEEHSYSNHTGGSIAFDKYGDLYVSVGDNTIPFDSKGYTPIDEGKSRIEYDAQRSAGNTNDLRGKILRIHPKPGGTYSIPDGNLFPKGMPKTRPEIYVMGDRNPFRISIDPQTNYLYWGEVGPDASKDSLEGPRGYDEINQARKAGNYGWPYFVADNKPYADVNFATGRVGKLFDAQRPVNNAPRNTGIKVLPPAQKALIWYPYALSEYFPLLGSGGRTAMAGPVYHYDSTLKSDVKFPKYYDKGLFIYDWSRNWIMIVRLDENGNYESMEPFMPSTSFSRIIDMEFGPDGALYTLEYGQTWYQPNSDARLSRIEFSRNMSASKKDSSIIKMKDINEVKSDEGEGATLISKNDCKSCHAIDHALVGPSFIAIAKRYKSKPKEKERLAAKIILGGAGQWGERVMTPHPKLSKQQALDIVDYICSLPQK